MFARGGKRNSSRQSSRRAGDQHSSPGVIFFTSARNLTMVKLPSIKPKKVLKTLLKHGFEVQRQTGSHVRLIHPDGRATTVAMHNRDLPRGTLKAILKQSELTLEEFFNGA